MVTAWSETLAAQKNYTASIWKPRVNGDMIGGKCLSVEMVTSKFTADDKLVIRVDATEVVSDGQKLPPGVYAVWSTAVVKRAAVDQKLRPGDEVGILFTGVAEGKNRKEYKFLCQRTEASEPYAKPVKEAATADSFKDDIPFGTK